MKWGISLLLSFFMYSQVALASSVIPLEVSGTQTNSIQRLSYNFGRVMVHSISQVIFRVSNTGTADIQRERFSMSGADFRAYTDCPVIMPPHESCSLKIVYTPMTVGSDYGQMQMIFNDSGIVIDLYGQSYQ